jgi:hypothetical protein
MRQRIAIASTACLLALASISARQSSTARIFYLDIGSGGRVLSANADGSDVQIVSRSRASVLRHRGRSVGGTLLDDHGRRQQDDGTTRRSRRRQRRHIVPGGTFTPKQLKLDRAHGKLYWSDREGLRVMRANLDGSRIETLVETAQGEEARRDARNWCVGIALDVERGKVYWTQKGSGGNGRILRANLEIPKGGRQRGG